MYRWLQRWFSRATDTSNAADMADMADMADTVAAPPVPTATRASALPSRAPRPGPAQHGSISFDQKDDVNANYYNWLFDNQEGDLDTTALETDVLGALSTILGSRQSGADLVRRMPGLIPQLLQSLKSDDFSGAQLSRTISHDVVLVAAVIRLANSSLTGTGQSITSVEHAVLVIGQEGLRQLITGVAFRPIIDLNSGHFTRALAPRIWDQSERCAVANRLLAEAMDIDPFEAFLAGLVQHVGLIVALRIMDQAAKDGAGLGSPMFCASLLRDARTLTCNIVREWNFPDAIRQAIAEQANMGKGSTRSALGQLLSLSDYLSKVRVLVEHDRLTEGDARLFKGLGPQALACYRGLDAQTDESVDTRGAA